jgi:hypothetical protein
MVLPDTRVGGNHFVFVLSVNVHMNTYDSYIH